MPNPLLQAESSLQGWVHRSLIRLVILGSLVVALSSVVIGIALWRHQDAKITESVTGQALAFSRAIAATGNQAIQRNLYLLQETISRHLDDPNILDVEIVDTDDLIMASRRETRIGRTLTDQAWRTLREGGVEAVVRSRTDDGAPVLIVVEPLIEKERIEGWVRVVYALGGLEEERRQELSVVLGLVLVILIILLVLNVIPRGF